jgi:hypothetical protein
VKKYKLGSVLAGGNSAPGGNDKSPAAEWLKLMDALWEASMSADWAGEKIPVIFGIDSVHGNANVPGATVFPHNIGLGAMRDPELVRKIGEVTAKEMVVTGFDWDFSPTVAVPRDDRWGRTYEGWSEDPSVPRAYAPAMVEGLQGRAGTPEFLGDGKVIATVKHFVGDGGTAGGRDQGDTQVNDITLRAWCWLSARARSWSAVSHGQLLVGSRHQDARLQGAADRCREGRHEVRRLHRRRLECAWPAARLHQHQLRRDLQRRSRHGHGARQLARAL